MVRSTSEAYCRQRVAQFARLGLEVVGLYSWLVQHLPGMPEMQTAYTSALVRELLPAQTSLGLPIVGLDCEDPEITDAAAAIAQARALADWVRAQGDQQAWHYNARWYVQSVLYGLVVDPGTPLWHADYSSDLAPLGPVLSRPFGGWERAIAHQFTNEPPPPFRASLDLSYVFATEESPTMLREFEDLLLSIYATRSELAAVAADPSRRPAVLAAATGRMRAVLAVNPDYPGGVAWLAWNDPDSTGVRPAVPDHEHGPASDVPDHTHGGVER